MKIGFIGLGIMGKPMCKNLQNAGNDTVVFDINTAAVDELVTFGSTACTSAAEVASQCELIITMLPNSPHVREVILGTGGVLEGLNPGSIVVDMSSINPIESQSICAEVEAKGGFMLDAPVSGGEPKAVDATLSIMVGGKPEIFNKVKGILGTMGASVLHCGDIGAGNTTKLANQIVVAANIAAVGEALVFAKKAGVEPEAVYNAIRGGLAGSTVMDAKAPMMLQGNFTPGFRIALHIKDLNNVIDTGHNVGAPIPMTSMIMEMMQWLKSNDCDTDDHSALVKYFEGLGNTSLSS